LPCGFGVAALEGEHQMTHYYKKLLRTNETVLHRGKLHWRVYLRAFGLLLVGAALIGAGGAFRGPPLTIVGFVLMLLAATTALDAWWRRLTTEIVVTDMRVIWKRNWIAVKTREINLSKIETVDIRQSIFDRLIGSGTVVMVGTGGSWEPVWPVAKPRILRNAIAIG
jgi:uncharacterized membrane protein YdbT with pleckstrin-like domain